MALDESHRRLAEIVPRLGCAPDDLHADVPRYVTHPAFFDIESHDPRRIAVLRSRSSATSLLPKFEEVEANGARDTGQPRDRRRNARVCRNRPLKLNQLRTTALTGRAITDLEQDMNRKLMTALLMSAFLTASVATPFAAGSGSAGAAPGATGTATPGAGQPGTTVPKPNAVAPSTTGSAPRDPAVNPAVRGDPECSGQVSGSPRKSGVGPSC
jgi:hypothetical protein